MDFLPTPLCSYCRLRSPRVADVFCCDGCKTLFDLQDLGLSNLLPRLAENAELLLHIGKDLGTVTRFECHVDPISCEACLQGLAHLDKRIPGLRDLQWNRHQSVLSFHFAKGAEQPSEVFRFLHDLQLSPRWKTDGGGIALVKQRIQTARLGITAALAANLMLFSVPIYAGLAGSLQTAFEWVQFFLFLPVFFWSALPFYRGAWIALRLRQLSVDLPLTMAFVTGGLFSAASLFRGEHHIYFDSLAGFLFLILWSRSLLENSLAHYLESPSLERFFEKPLFQVVRNGLAQTLPWKDLHPGDDLLLEANDRVPVDGKLLSSSAEIETAWMTGEKLPHWRLRGSLIEAGSRLLSKSARVEVQRPTHETEFAALLGKLQTANQKIHPSLEATLGNALVLSCFAVIAALLIFGRNLTMGEIGARSVALLIVACPCAISFAAPLARAKANRLAFQKGFWVQDPLVWTRLTNVRKIAFDKTGTLTGGLFVLASDSPMVDSHWKRIILSLENISRHPIAESLRRAWGPLPLFPVQDAREIPGLGVEGRIEGARYLLRGSDISNGELHIDLIRDGKKVIQLVLQDDAAPDVERTLARFQQRYELFIISGDHQQRVKDFGKRYGFSENNLYGALSPQQKLQKLEDILPDIYVGDGTNDLLAMKTAPVSIAVAGASPEAQAASDILMFDSSFGRCDLLFDIAKATASLNRRNLSLALFYNLAAGSAAVAGLIHPLGAAILMPIASFTLLASTLWGTKTLRQIGQVA